MDLTHLHPMIVHFPIALLIVGFLSDIVGLLTKRDFFTQTGFYLFTLGAVGVIAAFVTGDQAGDGIIEEGALKQALEIHEEAATLAIWVTSIAAVFRIALFLLKKYSGVLKMVSLALGLLAVMAIARTGYYGGELVYKHAAGVQLDFGSGTSSTEKDDD
jgi:uncharacterized membrane protein